VIGLIVNNSLTAFNFVKEKNYKTLQLFSILSLDSFKIAKTGSHLINAN
jgi:hypothetical protein